jgi:uncharacterized protein (TIGR02246 family)
MAGATLDKQEVKRLARQFEAAFKRGDFATMASFYADGATFMPEGNEAVRGRRGIQQFWQAAHEQRGVKEVTINVHQVESSADMAYEVGSATVQIQPPEGHTITDSLRYVVIWKRQADGMWRIAVDISNRSAPA